ncbi:hypothetical protein evm_009261 [Chilo suppressalis]|nr:hypothetical protein evm_009261 [Chilo suppressalis]
MDGIGRLGHDPPRGPSADWWVLTTADAAGTNGLTCLPKHGGARDSKCLSPEFDTEQAVERRLLAELARQQHQSEEDRRWLQMQEDNLKRLSNVQLPDTEASEPAPEGVVDPATRSQPRSISSAVFDLLEALGILGIMGPYDPRLVI